MNPNTSPNADPNNSATTSVPGSGIGNRFRGAAEIIHGTGEGLRGTILGAVDTIVKKGPTQNDEIARQGRLEVERGVARMKGQTLSGTMPYENTVSTASNNDIYVAPYASSGETHAPGLGAGTTTGGAFHPNHHREDAIAGIPQDQLRDAQSHAAQSQWQSQEPQHWHTNTDGVNHPPRAVQGAGFANNDTSGVEYASGTRVGGTYRPPDVADQNINDYPVQGNTAPVIKNQQLNGTDGGFAHDQGLRTRGTDARSSLN